MCLFYAIILSAIYLVRHINGNARNTKHIYSSNGLDAFVALATAMAINRNWIYLLAAFLMEPNRT